MLVGAEAAQRAALEPLLSSTALQPLDILWAPSADELLRRARRHRPDVVVLALPAPDSTIGPTLEELKKDDDTAQLPVIVVADVRGPVGRADLVVSPSDGPRLTRGARQAARPRGARAPRGALRVVVVEDELEILDFTRFVLEREGYDVVSVTSGNDALERRRR